VEETWPGMGDWLPGAVSALHTLKALGKTAIYSLRCHEYEMDDVTPRPAQAASYEVEKIRAMLDAVDLQDVEVYPNGRGKPPGKYYIDDRALRFEGDWHKILAKIAVDRAEAGRADVLLSTSSVVDEPVSVQHAETSPEVGVKIRKPEAYSLLPWEELDEVARVYNFGATYRAGARNWEKGYDWSASYDAMIRHSRAFWLGESKDDETGCSHLASVVFHALALMYFEKNCTEYDDRPSLPS
jgi:hypothetical protein